MKLSATNQKDFKNVRRLSVDLAKSISKKIRLVLPKEIEGEAACHVAVLQQAIIETSSRYKKFRRPAWHFLLNSPSDLSRVCDIAGLEADYISRLINTAIEFEDSKEVEAA